MFEAIIWSTLSCDHIQPQSTVDAAVYNLKVFLWVLLAHVVNCKGLCICLDFVLYKFLVLVCQRIHLF